MEYLEILNYTVTDSRLNDFDANISFEYSGKYAQIKIRSPWKREQIYPHSIEILSQFPFNEDQKNYFRKAVAMFLKNKLIE
jgi:sigma54-dependent transcription regulator